MNFFSILWLLCVFSHLPCLWAANNSEKCIVDHEFINTYHDKRERLVTAIEEAYEMLEPLGDDIEITLEKINRKERIKVYPLAVAELASIFASTFLAKHHAIWAGIVAAGGAAIFIRSYWEMLIHQDAYAEVVETYSNSKAYVHIVRELEDELSLLDSIFLSVSHDPRLICQKEKSPA